MIDWVTAIIPVRHDVIHGGISFKTCREGAVLSQRLERLTARGSYDATVQIKTNRVHADGQGCEIYLDGNPAKFLQGHNVIGSDDICYLVAETVKRIFEAENQPIDDFSYRTILNGGFILKRIDINYSYELPTFSDVKAWISAAAVQSRLPYRGKPKYYDTSVYWGLGSSTWHIKAYSKFNEIINGRRKSQKLPPELANSPLLPFTENKLRIELQLSKELKKIALDKFNKEELYAYNLTPKFINETFQEYVGRIEMNGNIAFTDDKLQKLPARLRMTVVGWRAGYDMKSELPRNTFYRHRKEIMRLADVDISLPCIGANAQENNVVPFVRPLLAKPAEIPETLNKYVIGL